jgi:hypothetical protein
MESKKTGTGSEIRKESEGARVNEEEDDHTDTIIAAKKCQKRTVTGEQWERDNRSTVID